MPKKELYLYSNIYRFVAESLISQMEENKSSEITVRIDTNGGDPQAAFGIIAKMKERSAAGKKTLGKVDGRAYSAGSFLLPYFDKVTALNTSSFIIHRAAYPEWYEKDGMTAEEKTELIEINKDLRKALESKIDPVLFARITGKNFDEIFSMNQRINVTLKADVAKSVGLIDEIFDINESSIAAEISSKKSLTLDDFKFEDIKETPAIETKKDILKPNNTNMTLDEIKTKHPEVFAAIEKNGSDKERDRISAWMVFVDIDAAAVKKGIEGGGNISQMQMAEFSRKALSAEALKNIAADSAPAIETKEEDGKIKTEKEKNIEAFMGEVKSGLGIAEKK
jgi:ATP-dependent protease ClpP protease subunit